MHGSKIDGRSKRWSLVGAKRGHRYLAAVAIVALVGSGLFTTPAASAAADQLESQPQRTVWTQQAELKASPYFGQGDFFGSGVGISGKTAVVGATDSAGAYIFDNTGGSWTQEATLSPPSYGGSVAISGSTVVVGSSGAGGTAVAAYVFTDQGGSWVQQAELTAPDAATPDSISVAISGSTIAVGASGTSGSRDVVYVFGDTGGSWVQQAELTAPAGAESATFGASVGIDGSTIVVGEEGAAYVYSQVGSHWTRQAKLATPDSYGGVAISGTTVVAGGDPETYVFSDAGGSWSPEGVITNPPKATHDLFGFSVAMSRGVIAVAAVDNDHGEGSVFVYKQRNGSWTRVDKLVASDRAPCFKTDEGTFCDQFGNMVAMAGTNIIVGSASWGAQTGSAYIFAPAGAGTTGGEVS